MVFQSNYLRRLNKLIKLNLINSRKNSILLLGIFLFLWVIVLVLSISKGLQFQIYNLLILTGLWLGWEQKIERDQTRNIRKRTFFLAILIITTTLIKGINIDSTKDIFFYLTIPLLNFGLILLYDGISLFKKSLGLMFLASLVPIKEILLIPLENYLPLLTSNITWFILRIVGINSKITNNIIFFEKRGISVEDGCSGADQVIFGISLLMIFYVLFPLRKRIHFSILILLTITISFIENCFRLSILGFINSLEGLKWDRIFDFFHISYGSIIFTSLTCFIISKSYFEFIKRELIDLR